MSISQVCLASFLALLSWQIGLSMEFATIGWLGSALSVFALSKAATIEKPTWGLLFVLFTAGGLLGNQVLEEWAAEGSWVQTNGLGAGFILSLLCYMLWSFAARDKVDTQRAIERESQNILAWGLLLMLLGSPPSATVITLFAERVPLIPVVGIVLACLVLMADRCAGQLVRRSLLLLPMLAIVPFVLMFLSLGQAPLISLLGDLIPRPSDFASTGFAPYQTMRASVFLQPSNRPVMRVYANTPDAPGLPPPPYLAGNRLVNLSEQLIWLPSQRPFRAYNNFNAQQLDTGAWRYAIDNHHIDSRRPTQVLDVQKLNDDDYMFLSPETSHVSGRFETISLNAADVWTPAFERGNDKRWTLELGGGNSVPEEASSENLSLPEFWDETLQAKSLGFAGADRQSTVDNVLSHFTNRRYSLQTDFDSRQPFHDFFLNEDPAYCFWFATGATLALRANGVPSRLVGGYVIHEQIGEDMWLVRERDAHSWVEWQDGQGYWHTIDPTPASIDAFFDGYDSSLLSVWYHRFAGQWQLLLDAILADPRTASIIRYGGMGILIFLFAREYRRIRGQGSANSSRRERWNRLWSRFLAVTRLPANATWTASTYSAHLPADWNADQKALVTRFLTSYSEVRFSSLEEQSLRDQEQLLKQCEKALAS